MDNGQKTPRGHPDFYSYVKILRVFIWNRQMDRQTAKYTRCAWAGGTESQFVVIQLCCCVIFWFWREIGFGFTYLCT
jgi:hypothetical protein